MSEDHPELPTAGRKPPHTGETPPERIEDAGARDDDGGETRRLRGDDVGGETRRLNPPGEARRLAAPDEGPTVQQAAPAADLEGPTRPLRRPLTDPPAAGGTPAATGSPAPASASGSAESGSTTPGSPAPGSSAPGEAPGSAGSPSPDRAAPAEGVREEPGADGVRTAEPPPDPPTATTGAASRRRPSPAGVLILVLLALFGFTFVVQLRSNEGDEGLAGARQEDLVRILSDLEARDSRLQSEISALETSQRQLTSGVAGRQAALDEAAKRAGELGLLAGTLPGRGPGLRVVMDEVKASAVLNAVQELRGAGGEVMQLAGDEGAPVRIVASSYFVDAEGGGIIVDGARLAGPYVLDVIGVPQTMQTALQIPGGVVASVNSGGGSVTLEQRTMVEVTAVRAATTLQYARPVS